MIEVQAFRKEFGDLVAVDDVSFRAMPGKIFGLLGPNGAGKSTTISCISGLLPPTNGKLSILGHDVVKDAIASREKLGVVPQELALYEDLSATENLSYWGAAHGLRGAALRARIEAVLDEIGLADRAKERSKNFSGGMKRRLNFGCGIVHEPEVLLLDEPTVGVDPQSRVRLLELVRKQASTGTTVLYTTHYMEEAEELCDNLGIIDHGKLIAEGSLAELRSQMAERDLLRLTGRFDPQRIERALQDDAEFGRDLEVVQGETDQLTLSLADASQKLPKVFTFLAENGAEIRETTLTQPSLESLFIKLTGKELRE